MKAIGAVNYNHTIKYVLKIQCVYSYIGAVIKLRISAYEFFILTKSAYINISLNKSAYALLFQLKVRMMGNLIDMEIKGYEQVKIRLFDTIFQCQCRLPKSGIFKKWSTSDNFAVKKIITIVFIAKNRADYIYRNYFLIDFFVNLTAKTF